MLCLDAKIMQRIGTLHKMALEFTPPPASFLLRRFMEFVEKPIGIYFLDHPVEPVNEHVYVLCRVVLDLWETFSSSNSSILQ